MLAGSGISVLLAAKARLLSISSWARLVGLPLPPPPEVVVGVVVVGEVDPMTVFQPSTSITSLSTALRSLTIPGMA